MGNKNSKIRLNINSSDLQHKRIFLTDKNTPANTIANNDNVSNKKSNRQFLKKYSARSELINKEGVKGIMLSPSQKKIKLPNKSTSQKTYLPPINQQFQPLQRNRISYVNSELIYNPIQPNQKEDGRRFPNVLSIDNQFYTLVLRHISAYYYPTIKDLDDNIVKAMFVLAKDLYIKYKPSKKVKLPFILREVEKAFDNNDIELWKLASFYQ